MPESSNETTAEQIEQYDLTKEEIEGLESIAYREQAITQIFTRLMDHQASFLKDKREFWSRMFVRLNIPATPTKKFKADIESGKLVREEK